MKKQDGLMLIELLIAMILLGIVLSIAYMFFSFGISAFSQGEERAIVQQSVRRTSIFITNELRYAKEIIINPDGGVSVDNYRYIYHDVANNSIVYQTEDGTQILLADSQADGIPYSIVFDSNEPENVVEFNIDGGNGLYVLKSRVQAINLELYSAFNIDKYGELILVNEGDGTIIKYKLPPD